jgi:hypothetical protein
MSCIACNLHNGNFKTEKNFHELNELLQQLVENSKFEFLGKKESTRFLEVRYLCRYCNTIWILSVPDQAFRGGWREE